MRFFVREDLGGYGASLGNLRALSEIEITKPFVLLHGPNGSGKSTLISMMRATMGLCGPDQGSVDDHDRFWGAFPNVEDCNGDLGKLAGYRRIIRAEPGVPKGLPGVLDVHALGWRGHKSWLFNSRTETAMPFMSHFSEGLMDKQIESIFGSKSASHGEWLRNPLLRSVRIAIGDINFSDPYDNTEMLPPVRQALFEAVAPKEGRPTERWLLLDEPEVAMDVEALTLAMSALVGLAELGKFRVFCASHSLIFPAGLADSDNVQVVNLGERDWMKSARNALSMVSNQKRIAEIADNFAMTSKKARQDAIKAAEKAHKAKVAKTASGFRQWQKDALLAAMSNQDHRLPEKIVAPQSSGFRAAINFISDLRKEKIVATDKGDYSEKPEDFCLTPYGVEIASILVRKEDKKRAKDV